MRTRALPGRSARSSTAVLPSSSSLVQTKDARKELVELREMKEDVERREKAQAEVISQQVRSACLSRCDPGLGAGS